LRQWPSQDCQPGGADKRVAFLGESLKTQVLYILYLQSIDLKKIILLMTGEGGVRGPIKPMPDYATTLILFILLRPVCIIKS